MRGVAYDPVFRAKLMALHQHGVPLTMLSAELGVAREVLGQCGACTTATTWLTFSATSRAVEQFVWYYNHERPNLSLGGMTPVDRRKLYFRQAERDLCPGTTHLDLRTGPLRHDDSDFRGRGLAGVVPGDDRERLGPGDG